MALKRHFPFADDGGAESSTRVGRSKRCCCGHHDQVYTLNEFMEKLDPSDLQLVQKLCQKYLINVPHLSIRTRKYRLQFKNKLPESLFTERKLTAENNNNNNMPIEIEIVDPSNEIIKSGPMATAEIEIVVLDGDFDGEKNGEWTEKEFEEHVVVPRKGKGPLLVGNLVFQLHDGVGCISKVKFTDNSKWSRSENFRLGVKIHGGIGMVGDVREGISNAFRVKDRRVEKIRKDRPLSMNDEVCCLRGIFKDGPFHKKLIENKINTVRDFLCYCSNHPPNTLRDMLGMFNGIWQKTYGHAIEFEKCSDIVLYAPLNLPAPAPPNLHAPDQISVDVPVSNSPQISDVLVQLNNGSQQLASYAESEHPISDISTSAQNMPVIKLGIEPRNSFKTNSFTRVGSWKGTKQLGTSWEILMEGSEKDDVPNKFYIGSLSFRHKWLKLLFVARLKVAALRSRESRYSETSSPRHNAYDLSLFRFERPLEDLSPIFNFEYLRDIDVGPECFVGIDNGFQYSMDKDNYTDLW